jgi:eukaryotic-like serine/threonine-protein kinase
MPRLDLNPQSAAALNRLLDQALDLAPDKREQWLADLPQEFAALKPHLRDLLSRAAGVETSDFLGTLPKFGAPPDSDRTVDDQLQPGVVLEPYRLIRELGRGGMGAVWLAERADGLLNRRVALKLPRAAWLHEGFAERLERERDILASLEHPNIARLYDAGVAANGRPFLALEFVEGQPLDHYCRTFSGRPAQVLNAILKLFLQAAQAVAYAHGKLILHRDLKPANILVAADGSVRLLDFGIAKLLTSGEAHETALTQYAGRALSPEYASPEQVLGEPLTVASDVYALGVVLYELLTSVRPYKLERVTRGALEDAILHAEPERPSSMVEGPRRALLRGDLDTLVLHALRKSPAERYPTVHALIDDVERFLSGRPVQVRPDTFGYRTQKFVRRHKLAVAAAAAVALAIVTGSGIAMWQTHVARVREQSALAVKNFIADIFHQTSPAATGGKPVTAVELLKQAEPKIAQIPRSESAVRVELQTIVGDSLLDLEDNESAARVLTAAVSEGEQTLGSTDPIVLHARVRLAESHAYLGEYETARKELTATMQEMDDAELQNTAEYVAASLQRAAFAIDAADYDEAERFALETAANARRVLGPKSQPLDGALQLLGIIYKNKQRPQLASRYSREAYELALQIHASNPRHPDVIDAQMGYADALQLAGDLPGAETQMAQAVANAEQVFGADSMMVGFFLRPLAEVERELGELNESIRDAQRSLEIAKAQDSPPAVAHANRLNTLGRGHLDARHIDAARSSLAAALEIRRTLNDTGRRWSVQAAYGSALRMAGELAAAEKQLSEIPIDAPDLADEDRVRVLRELGVVRARQGRHQEALSYFDRAVAASSDRAEVELERAEALSDAGEERFATGDLDGAAASLESAVQIFADRQRVLTPAHADALSRLARVRLAQQRTEVHPLHRA